MEEQQVETDGITAGGAGGSAKDLQHEQRSAYRKQAEKC
jgi:hypothetical protein